MTNTLEKILYVEDETKLQFLTKFALERLGGFSVAACGSGAEALRVAAKFEPDLALLDIRMPGMSGPETLAALRQQPGFENLPAIFVTADVSAGYVERCREVGALDAIAKPYEPKSLPDRLREIWASRPGA